MDHAPADTIVAIATPHSAGGVGIVRLSGPAASAIGEQITRRRLTPRYAHHARFHDAAGAVIDDGIALLFKGPASFTGEDVVELQAHGSPAVLQELVARAVVLGARRARPGEFSERAFLAGRLDLAQAEAIADLIAAGDARAARAARRALDGEFSRRVEAIAERFLHMRVHVEAAIDFVDEPLETLGGHALREAIAETANSLDALLTAAERGRRLRDGFHVVIVGPPNAGKSSLLNALAGADRAIVTDVAGTTRDLLRETVRVDGVELTLVDTAGLRAGGDAIEQEGMRRARAEMERADLALAVVDARSPIAGIDAVHDAASRAQHVLWLHNKADLLDMPRALEGDALHVSARTGLGLDALHARLRAIAQGASEDEQGEFTARARHVDALARARSALHDAGTHLDAEALDLAAEALREGHDALGEITGRVCADALLGHVFASFCVGK